MPRSLEEAVQENLPYARDLCGVAARRRDDEMTSKKDRITQSDGHNARGIELADRGWLDEAVNEFTKAIELDQDSEHAYDNLAKVFAEKGSFIEALAEYQKVVS